jgi:hypothetical protein
MNLEKAREYFSSYREGALEGGLRQTFEQKLRSDRQIRAEYEAFSYAMEQLDTLKDEEIPVPLYLSERIHARLEESNRPEKPVRGLVFYLPRFAFAAAIAAAIVFAANGVFHSPSGSTIQAGAFGSGDEPNSSWPSESIGVDVHGSAVQVHYSSAGERIVQILDGKGTRLRQYQLKAGEPMKAELKNSNATAAVFEVRVSDAGPDEFIAVPGSSGGVVSGQEDGTAGGSESGNVIDFMQALANRYGKPVVYTGKDNSTALSWNLSAASDKAEADRVLKGTNLDDSVTMTNVLSISDR